MSVFKKITELVRQRSGPLTRELLLQPSRFGLGKLPERLKPDAVTDMVCGYCSTGCSLRVHLKDSQAINLTPSPRYPVNLGMACPKGWEALTVLDSPERATRPLLRDNAGKLQPVDWRTAMTQFVTRFRNIQNTYGNDAVAFLSTGQMATEEMAFLGALAKFGMGMLHGDGNTRQCMATAVVAYKQAFGFDAPPYTYADFEESDVIVLVGSNLCIAHPIMWERVMRNPHSPEIIVVDPRMTETAMSSTMHLPVKPKGDQALFYGIARILIENGWVDHDFIEQSTSDFASFAEFVQQFDDERVTKETGLSSEQIDSFAERIHQGKRVSFWWTMGVNQSHQGVRTAQAMINLALITGNIGRPGTGANSITGQCNAMGSRLFSNTTNLLGGHDFANAEHREKIANILGIDPSLIPTQNSKPYHKILDGILRGKIKGLWVICTNPAHSWINQIQCRDILERLDFLVVQDMYQTTETAQMADLVLPAAGWGEKEGTFINSERRIGRLKKVRKAPGEALSDFHIFRLVANYWGCEELFSDWQSPADVFQILKRCSTGQPCDITGIRDYEAVDSQGGIQWPAPEQNSDLCQERRLFADGRFYHADGKAKFIFDEPSPIPEMPNEKYPLVLSTGRGSASQWHTQTRTRQSAVLRKLYPEHTFVELNPKDAKELAVGPQDEVVVESQRGDIRARVVITHAVQPGQVFVPMHYEEANRLTLATFDPHSHQPAYKACAVRIRKFLQPQTK
ncbi:molybdopterin oxidoreductase family protein [Thalassoroseus pseudoceratinae]|uniref:molybdopterin oxidoreductase family protein n=1 Tax=Thalassoroseus pseudoceratinae TaxID=2713176 RepID=UPI0014244005|nr:nitrate reductase [Thalassoroseus pseudoceratinae]